MAAEWMGWQNIASCEINPFGRKVLQYYWPNSYHHDDIHTFTYEKIKDRINPNIPVILTGGFPCQPYSLAGKRRGKEDNRHLWPEMLRIIREIRPRYVVGENVFGLISWDGGLVFDEVHTDLEREGYEVQAVVIPAAAVNAPHGRDRVWFVAHSKGQRIHGEHREHREKKGKDGSRDDQFNSSNETPTTHTDSNGQQRSDCEHEKHTGKGGEYAQHDVEPVDTENTNSDRCNNQDGEAKPCQREQRESCSRDIQRLCREPGAAPYTDSKRYEKCEFATIADKQERQYSKENIRIQRTDWSDFPTQSPIRNVNDGIPGIMVRNIKKEIYATISERYTNKDLQEVWDALQSEEIRDKIGRLYKIHEPGLLLQTLQLCASPSSYEIGSSVFSEEASKDLMRKLQNHKTFANTPHGRELEKQFAEQFGNALPYLSHEIALVTMEAERASRKFSSWHRNESIKAAGNAIVPQVAYEIFKAIQSLH